MAGSGIAYRVLDGAGAAANEADLLALADDVYGESRDAEAVRRWRVWRRQPGFALVEAQHGEYPVGHASVQRQAVDHAERLAGARRRISFAP